MARTKQLRSVVPALVNYLQTQHPDLRDARMSIRLLDGPPQAPRYVASVERCTAARCPFGIPAEDEHFRQLAPCSGPGTTLSQ
jgi:hypothetical protein